jgi:hypothetical protein
MVGGHFAVVEDGLIGQMDFKDLAKHVGRFPGRDGERDVEGEDKGQGVERVSDGGNVFARSGCDVSQLLGGEVVFTELVAELELGGFEGTEEPFGEIQFA